MVRREGSGGDRKTVVGDRCVGLLTGWRLFRGPVVPESPQAMSGTSHAGASAWPAGFVPGRAITTVRGPGSSPGRQVVVFRDDKKTKRRRDIAQLRAITTVRGPGSGPGRQVVVFRTDETTKRQSDITCHLASVGVRGPGSSPGRLRVNFQNKQTNEPQDELPSPSADASSTSNACRTQAR